MNECARYSEYISRLIDNDLNESESEELNKHICSCDECRSLYNAFTEVSSFISDDLDDVPEGFSENVMTSIRRASIKPVSPLKKYRKVISLAVSAAAIIAVVASVPNLMFSRSAKSAEFMNTAAPAAVSETYASGTVSNSARFAEKADFTADEAEVCEEALSEPAADINAPAVAYSAAANGSAVFASVMEDSAAQSCATVYTVEGSENCSAVYSFLTNDAYSITDNADSSEITDIFDIDLSDSRSVIHISAADGYIMFTVDDSDELFRCDKTITELTALLFQ